MKLAKPILIGVGILLVVVALAVAIPLYYIDSIAKSAIERGGTHALGVATTLESADVGVMGGTFAMKGLKVANPQGYNAEHFFTLGTGNVSANLGSITQDVIEVPSLALEDIRANLEQSLSGSNYRVILDNLEKLEKGQSAPPPDAAKAKRFIIRDLAVKNVQVRVDVSLPGQPVGVAIPIDEIRLKDVGSAEGGMTAGEITGVVVKAVLATAAERGGDILPADLLNDLKSKLANLESINKFGVEVVGVAGDAAEKLADGLSKVTPQAEKAIKKGADAIRGLGDLIPKKDKK